MKTVEQLLELKDNPYYAMSPEEKKLLNDFLSKNSGQTSQAKSNGKDSEKNIPATVLNKNKVQKETGEIPKINDSAQKETAALEEAIHPDAVKATKLKPRVVNARAEDLSDES